MPGHLGHVLKLFTSGAGSEVFAPILIVSRKVCDAEEADGNPSAISGHLLMRAVYTKYLWKELAGGLARVSCEMRVTHG
jgi:hypothetical protein